MLEEEFNALTNEARDQIYHQLWTKAQIAPAYLFIDRIDALYKFNDEPIDETDRYYLENTP
jgi:hypothetical protein